MDILEFLTETCARPKNVPRTRPICLKPFYIGFVDNTSYIQSLFSLKLLLKQNKGFSQKSDLNQ